jgi:methionyl-tRNA formyltransferase
VSQPDRRRGRGRTLHPSPVSARALERELPLLRPERVGTREVAEALRAHAPDIGVVVAFGQFLPRRIRELPARGYLINGHASLLPRHRGAAPIPYAILTGDRESGVCVMRVEREMDAGPVALERRTPIGPEEDAGALADRLSRLTAEAIVEALDAIADDRVDWREQDPAAATLAPKIGSADAELDWSQPAAALALRVRAMGPSPGAHTDCDGERLRILAARAETGSHELPPGTLSRDAAGRLRIATGDGWLLPTRVQRPGGKPMDIDAYLRGHALTDGTRLGSAAG